MVILKWGSGIGGTYSKVIKLMTLSSTESEHVAVNEGCTLALHADYMVTEMGLHSHGKVVIYQDNTFTIWPTANEGNFVKIRRVDSGGIDESKTIQKNCTS